MGHVFWDVLPYVWGHVYVLSPVIVSYVLKCVCMSFAAFVLKFGTYVSRSICAACHVLISCRPWKGTKFWHRMQDLALEGGIEGHGQRGWESIREDKLLDNFDGTAVVASGNCDMFLF